GCANIAAITKPLLRVRRVLLDEFCRLDRMARTTARSDAVCRRLMTAPGIGVIVALTYRTGIDVPERFALATWGHILVSRHVAIVPDKSIMTVISAAVVTRWCVPRSIKRPMCSCITAAGQPCVAGQ